MEANSTMPLQLDDYDLSILKSLLKDGRKSFRGISRETGITTPTVKARFNRLVNVGFIKSVSPIFNFDIIDESIGKTELRNRYRGEDYETIKVSDEETKNNKKEKYQYNNSYQDQVQLQHNAKSKIKKGVKINLDCEFCKGPISGTPHVYKFANYERFFCCKGCMSGYKKKYSGRIDAIKRRFDEGSINL
jgi:DNA-binding Lrp family transcriptional regulator